MDQDPLNLCEVWVLSSGLVSLQQTTPQTEPAPYTGWVGPSAPQTDGLPSSYCAFRHYLPITHGCCLIFGKHIQPTINLRRGKPLIGQFTPSTAIDCCCHALLCHVQGYGLTETCAASCIAVPDSWAMHGTNGPCTPCTELRLESVPGGRRRCSKLGALCAAY